MRPVWFAASALLSGSLAAQTPLPAFRPPATPLITHNPYFSIWSNTDELTGSPTRHWTGAPQPIAGLVRIDGHTMRFMGRDPSEAPAMQQTAHEVLPTHTRYSFTGGGVQLDVTFLTPAILSDLDVLSRPVTYLTFAAHATDGASHTVAVMLDAGPAVATSYEGQPTVALRSRTATEDVVSLGTQDQRVLNRSGDNLRIDWGYFHLAAARDSGARFAIGDESVEQFLSKGTLPESDALPTPPNGGRGQAHVAALLDLGPVTTAPVAKHLLVSYTEGFAIQLLERNLRPYWQRKGKTEAAMLDEAERDYSSLEQRASALDREMIADLVRVGGPHYAALAVLAYRQSIAAHGFVADVNGDPLMFEKENFSNGCTATVDVIYPTAPIFLLFNPKLLEAQLLPLMEYVSLPNRWRFPFAPHDLGQYPLANGQVYGGGEKTEEDQQPVEETGNMLIMIDAISRAEGNADLAARYWPKLTEWAGYLKEHGLDPENQLTTDDFAGHVTHNANLALKAIDALAAYADLAKLTRHDAEARDFAKLAHSYAAKWIEMDREGDHFKLAYDSPNTWSQKYNLVWDELLGYNLFPKSLRDSEVAFYLTKLNQYGLPLDSRADYTKLDWTVWTATLTDKPEAFNALIDAAFKWVNETPTRVPLTDWYDTKTGKQVGFQARSVVGGVFIKALSDREMTEKWRAKAAAAPR